MGQYWYRQKKYSTIHHYQAFTLHHPALLQLQLPNSEKAVFVNLRLAHLVQHHVIDEWLLKYTILLKLGNNC